MVTFDQWLESDGKRLHLDVRIEGVGPWLADDELGAASDDGRYRFALSMPAYAVDAVEPSALWLPYLKRGPLPDLLSEENDGVFGGIPDFGGITVHLVDWSDALTVLFATEVAPVTVLAEDIDAEDVSFDVSSASEIAQDSLIFIGGEAVRVSGVSSNTLSLPERGYLETEAVAHYAGDAVYLTNPYLIGRRVQLRIAPLFADDPGEEEVLFEGLVDGVEWDDVFKTWVLKATSVLRYLDRLVPREARTYEIAGYDDGIADDIGDGYLSLYNDSIADIESWGHWTGVNATDEYPPIDFYALLDGKEVIGCRTSATTTGAFVSHRALFGTERVEIKEGMKLRQVFVSGDPLGHWPSSFRSLDPGDEDPSIDVGTQSSHWIDLLLNLLTSPSDEHGLGTVCPNHDGVHRNYSTLPAGYGLGYPADLVDFDSFLEVKARTGQHVFSNFILGAKDGESASKLITEKFLEPMGAYLTMDSGLLRIFLPRIPLQDEDLPELDRSVWLLEQTERHTYQPRVTGRIRTAEHASSIKYEMGRTGREVVFLSSAFTETVGLRGQYAGRTNDIVVKVESADELLGDLYGARAQSRFLRQRRPRVELQGDAKIGPIWDSPAGSMVRVSLQAIPDLSQGVRDWVEVPADVRRREIRLELDEGGLFAKLELLAHSPGFLATRIAPAGFITAVATNTVTLSANRYTSSDAATGLPAADYLAFEQGDIVRLINPDGTSASAGTQEILLLSDTNTLELDGNFGGDLATDLILVAAAYDDSVTRQQDRYAYQADRASHTVATGVSARTYGED